MSKNLEEMKFDYSSNKNDFHVEDELMVTITLSEYRELVTVKANKDILVSQAEKDKYQREQENKTLKEQNDKLKGENYDLLQKLQEMGVKTEDYDDDSV